MNQIKGASSLAQDKEICLSALHSRLFCCLLLATLVFIVYIQVTHFDFVHYDDHVYVTDNPYVKSGMTLNNLRWALMSLDAGFWHPLTWLSLMLDYELYGLNAGGYHGTNVIFHIINTLLLFIVFERMTGALWRSCLVAALFAVHPLHVESVAWVAARKDVLSTFFFMLILLNYVYYAAKPTIWRYLILIMLFLLGLMAKPMLVTLPFILLLLDCWPLKRFDIEQLFADHKKIEVFVHIRWLLLEKVPFMVLTAGVSVLTVVAEHRVGALTPMISYPLDVRVMNALVSYVVYIRKMVWPLELAVFYPHPGLWPLWMTLASVLILVALTTSSLWLLRKAPYFFVGWFWYLGMLVPVIGLIQVGTHGMADRYTYLPLIGLFIIVVWGCADISKIKKIHCMTMAGIALFLLATLGIQSYLQIQYWNNAQNLFQHAIKVTKNNYIAYNNLGAALSRQGKPFESINFFKEALKIQPRYAEATFNLGAAFADQGKFSEAIHYYQQVLNIRPEFAEAYNNIGIILARQGQLQEAIGLFKMALRFRSDYPDARHNLDIALKSQRERDPPSNEKCVRDK